MKARFFGGSKTDDARLKAKQREAITSLDYPSIFSTPLSSETVDKENAARWIYDEIARILDIEDEVLSGMIVNMLFVEGLKTSKAVDPREVQLTLGGFIGKKAAYNFMDLLWTLLVDGKTFAKASLDSNMGKRQLVEKEAARDDQRAVRPNEPLSPTSSHGKYDHRDHQDYRYSSRRHPQRYHHYQDRRRSRSRSPIEKRRSRSRSRSRQRDLSRSYFEDCRFSEGRNQGHDRHNDRRSSRSSRSPQGRRSRYSNGRNQRKRNAHSSKSRSPDSKASTYTSAVSSRSSSLSVAAAEPGQNPCGPSLLTSQWDEARTPQAPAISLPVDAAVERMLRERALKPSTSQSHKVYQ